VLPAKLFALVPEQRFRLTIREHDASRRIDHHDRVRSGFDEIEKPSFDELRVAQHLQVGHVLVDVKHVLARDADRLARHVEVDHRTVATPMHRFVRRRPATHDDGHDSRLARRIQRRDEILKLVTDGVCPRVLEELLGSTIPMQDASIDSR
jgi:hypothetical protein